MKIEKLMVKEAQAEYIPKYKYSDYERWEGRWELISGHPYAMTPTPIYNHQIVSNNINIQLVEKLRNCKKCKAILPLDWIIDDENVVAPDNMVICYKPEGKFLTKPPSIIFEILSPSTEVKDKNVKFVLYQLQGVKHYVIVDIVTETAEVYRLVGDKYEKTISTRDEAVHFDLGECKFDFDFSLVWE
jgi:Uma2 family endonuclease